MGNGQGVGGVGVDLEELQTGSLGCWLRSTPLLPRQSKAREGPEIAGQREREREEEGAREG